MAKPDEKTLRILEQLLQVQEDNWEARTHLAELHLEAGDAAKAVEVLEGGGPLPDEDSVALPYAKALAQTSPNRAIQQFHEIIARNRKCAPAYFGLAEIYRARGLRAEAKHNYGIATVIDESLEDPAFRAWLEGEPMPREERPAASSVAASSGDSRPTAASDETVDFLLEESVEELELPEGSDRGLPRITFEDVGGMGEVKERIAMNIIYPFKNPETFKRFKRRPGGGILLYGPPGCGKTYIARATAGECGARFISIGITDVLSRWLGESEQRLHDLFHQARRLGPSVIFIDEIDALGMSRRDSRGSGMTTVVNQLLTELDGVHDANDNLMVLAATNAPWQVDSAFRRPGRFDRILFIPPPDEEARRAIFEIHLRELPHERLDVGRLVKSTRQFSGADIRAAIDRASETAIYQEMTTGRPGAVNQKSLMEAVKELRPSTLEWLETAKNYASYANRAGQYDELADFFERGG